MNEIQKSVNHFDRLALMFDDSSVYKLKSSIDLKIIEALILCLDIKEI
jgi:hypothetical protein